MVPTKDSATQMGKMAWESKLSNSSFPAEARPKPAQRLLMVKNVVLPDILVRVLPAKRSTVRMCVARQKMLIQR